ncbi:MAG: carboxypeptidase-like regulatory domain-containing protein [Candidatus Promineifilaceae bacterium]|nr:carboxypeptidase-like regulatory domain-containing protein [Candidatus Promineifilaceae bacterium]
MMTTRAVKALLARIVKVANEQGDEHSYIATSQLSTPIHAEHIEVLSAPDGAFVSDEALAAAVELSKMVNCVQDGSPSYRHPASVGSSFVSDVYKKAVGKSEDDPVVRGTIEWANLPLSPQQEEELKRAESILYVDPPLGRTEQYLQFSTLRYEIISQIGARSELRLALAQAEEAEKDSIQDRLEVIEAALTANRDLFSALDALHGISAAERIYNSIKSAGFPSKFERAHDLLHDPAFEITNPISNETHCPAAFFPNKLTEENWIPIRLTRAEIAATGVGGDESLPDLPRVAQQLEVNDDALDLVELEVQVLHVDRFWMWSALFENRQWRFRSGVEPFSTGEPDGQGQLPGFVTGLIFARNLRLTGRKNMVSSTGSVHLGQLKFQPLNTKTALKIIQPQLKPLSVSAAPVLTREATETPVLAARPARSSKPAANFTRINLPVTNISSLVRTVVTVRTVDSSERPLAGVSVTLTNLESGLKLKNSSAKNGAVVFRLPAEGNYVISAAKEGYKTFKDERRLTDQSSFTVRLEPLIPSALLSTIISSSSLVGTIPTMVTGTTVTVKLRKRSDDNSLQPLDVDAEVAAINRRTGERLRQTVAAGKDAVFNNLAREKFEINVFCAVYQPEGSTSQQVNVATVQQLEFVFKPRTIMQSDDTFLFGFLCYRTPLSPNPNPNADFGG